MKKYLEKSEQGKPGISISQTIYTQLYQACSPCNVITFTTSNGIGHWGNICRVIHDINFYSKISLILPAVFSGMYDMIQYHYNTIMHDKFTSWEIFLPPPPPNIIYNREIVPCTCINLITLKSLNKYQPNLSQPETHCIHGALISFTL